MKGIVIHNELYFAESVVKKVNDLLKKTEFGYTCEVTRDFLNEVKRVAGSYQEILEKTEYNKA